MKMPRGAALTVGAAASSAIILVAFFHAPTLPVAMGVVGAVLWTMWRSRLK